VSITQSFNTTTSMGRLTLNMLLSFAQCEREVTGKRTRLAKLIGLSCLTPDIVTAIVGGRQPAKLTAKMLASIDLPLCWREQRAALGF
jgi:hypothetical protein